MLRIGNVDTKSGSFDVDFWIWVDSLDDGPTLREYIILENGEQRPHGDWLDFPNGGNIVIQSAEYDEDIDQILLRVKGTFYSHYDLKNFPFEILKMKIHVESGAGNVFSFAFTEGFNSIEESAIMSDIYVNRPSASISVHEYVTNTKGLTDIQYGDFTDTFCTFTATFIEERGSSVVKYLLPLILITGLGVMPLWMGKEYVSRIILSTFLFGGMIVFVNTTISQLPDLTYLTIFDKIYITSYSLFTLSIASSVIQQRISSQDENSPNLQKVKKYSRLLIPIILIIGFASIVIPKY